MHDSGRKPAIPKPGPELQGRDQAIASSHSWLTLQEYYTTFSPNSAADLTGIVSTTGLVSGGERAFEFDICAELGYNGRLNHD